MNATDCFTLTVLGRCTVDGTEYVLYSDGALADAVEASDYDDVPRIYAGSRYDAQDRYDDGTRDPAGICGVYYVVRDTATDRDLNGDYGSCEEAEIRANMLNHEHSCNRYSLWCDKATAVDDVDLLSRILAACGVSFVLSGACGRVYADGDNDVEPPDDEGEGGEADIEQAPGEAGYMNCSCRDCFEGPIVGVPGDMCDGGIEAGCTLGDHECCNPEAYGGDADCEAGPCLRPECGEAGHMGPGPFHAIGCDRRLINEGPAVRCVSDRYDPRTVSYASRQDFLRMCRLCFGEAPVLTEQVDGWHDDKGLVLEVIRG